MPGGILSHIQQYAARMPGYRVPVVYERAGLVCAHCKLLLRNAVQTEEGVRLCQSCFKEIAW